ncbi:MAG TPA: ribosome biogenesis GTPase Der [Candidatus Polarisedimenticolia bacterium]|nr:ribosome biogenesis GTPase Der [Candidatus Polarisedimenticolia bacterium]
MSLPLVAIVGAPNAGKSTLFNRLLGRRRALVHARPGMTRDLNEQECAWGGRAIRLLDTGGLFAPGDEPLAEGVRRLVERAARRADVLILVVDGRAGLTPIDRELGALFRSTGRPVVLAVNKLDVPGLLDHAAEFHALGFDDVAGISAEHGRGIDELIHTVDRHLPDPAQEAAPPCPGELRLAIAGRPNVGKSSLLNRLLAEERVLVSEVPGTTRDTIDTLLRREGRAYRIADTAGLRRSGRIDPGPEGLSAMAARRQVEQADVALIVMDASEGVTQQDLHVAGIAHQAARPFMVLLNKIDRLEPDGARELLEEAARRLRFAPFAPIRAISARTGTGIAAILPLAGEVHAEASSRLSTGRLNGWLRAALTAHPPPSTGGKETRYFYAVQTGSNPPRVTLFGNRAAKPHFSYQRYLENSLRARFGLSRTPVIVQYRERPRTERDSKPRPKTARKRRV